VRREISDATAPWVVRVEVELANNSGVSRRIKEEDAKARLKAGMNSPQAIHTNLRKDPPRLVLVRYIARGNQRRMCTDGGRRTRGSTRYKEGRGKYAGL